MPEVGKEGLLWLLLFSCCCFVLFFLSFFSVQIDHFKFTGKYGKQYRNMAEICGQYMGDKPTGKFLPLPPPFHFNCGAVYYSVQHGSNV